MCRIEVWVRDRGIARAGDGHDAPCGVDQLDAWSRNGKWLYFSTTANDISGMSDVYRVSADGGTPTPVAADRYAAEYWAATGPDSATIAITARGLPYSQWWRKGHSHIDESEIWVVHGIAAGVKSTPKYEQLSASGSKNEWPMYSADGRTIYYTICMKVDFSRDCQIYAAKLDAYPK